MAGTGYTSQPCSCPPLCDAGDLISLAVAAAFSVPVNQLRATSRCRAPVAQARQSAMYLAHVALGLTFTEVGRAFGRHRTTAAHAVRMIEDRRQRDPLDKALAQLERALKRDVRPIVGVAP